MTTKEEHLDPSEFSMGFRASETSQASMTVQDILTALHSSCEFFVNFFLAEELTSPVPQFHKDVWEYLTSTLEYIALALPRGHAKTTLAKLVAVWHLLFTPTRFILYVSNTASVAAAACKDIMNYMRSANFASVFGAVVFEVEQDQRGYYEFQIGYVAPNGMIMTKKCILRALGAGQQIRGTNIDNTRPELAVVDDLEDDDNTATPLLQNKLKRWFFGAFSKALAKRRKIVYIGNMLSSKSLLFHFCESSDEWHSMRKGCILSDGQPLWPALWTLEAIKNDFVEYQKLGLIGLWFAEMMNLPIADGNLLIQPEEIPYLPELVPGEQEYAFITVDTAISRKVWGNDTAIVVHASKGGKWRCVEVVAGKYTPDQVFLILTELCRKWNTKCVGIEQTALQQALKFLFEVLMTVNQFHFECYEIPHKNKAKTERLAVWCSLLRKKEWALCEGDIAITQQLLTYDPTKDNNTDDIIDAASMGAVMTRFFMTAIMDSFLDSVSEQYRIKNCCKV